MLNKIYSLKISFILVLAALFSLNSYSQEIACPSTLQWHEHKIQNDPEYKNHIEEWQSKVDEVLLQKNPDCANGPIIIPLAIHFNSGENFPTSDSEKECAIDMCLELINQLNLDFAGEDPDAASFNDTFEDCFDSVLGESCLQFCLATQNHPEGFGLQEGDFAVTFGQADFFYETDPFLGLPSGTPVNPEWAGYINIYVNETDDIGLLGISNGIPGQFNGDGVMVNTCQFGPENFTCAGFENSASCGAASGFVQGETLTHELGHFLGLFHIWGDELSCSFLPSDTECSGSDQINDTPNMSCSYTGYNACNINSCDDLPATCGSPDMIMNFMCYADDECQYMFTSDQVDVMYATAIFQGFNEGLPIACGDPTCPAEIISQYQEEDIACASLGFYELPTTYPNLEMDDPFGATYFWSTLNYIESGGFQLPGNTYEIIKPSGCDPEEIEIFLNISCVIDSSLFLEGGSIVLTVYPDPETIDVENLVLFTDNACDGPSWEINDACSEFVTTVTQIDGPEFPTSPGLGQVTYEIALTYPEQCCEGTGECIKQVMVDYLCPLFPGCTNPEACNYDSNATVDNESCLFGDDCLNTGILDINAFEIKAIPNPVEDQMYFKIKSNTNFELLSIKIFDITGKILDEIFINNQSNPDTHIIPYSLKNYPTGLYFYELISDQKTISTNRITKF